MAAGEAVETEVGWTTNGSETGGAGHLSQRDTL